MHGHIVETPRRNVRFGGRLSVCSFLMIWLIVPVFAQDVTFRDLMLIGRAAIRDGQFDKAEHNLRLALMRAQGEDVSPSATFLCAADLGEVLLTEGKFVESEEFFNRALQM